jgi:proteasome accessory factor B
MATKIDNSERLFNLTCALLSSRYGLTKQEILSRVQGYKERYKHGGDNSSLDRQFERDKDDLILLGVHWELENPASAMEDNQEFRYRIRDNAFNWPKNVRLSKKQIAMLNLAAEAWSKTSMSPDASQGLMRLLALGESLEASNLIGVAPRIATQAASFEPLSEALMQSRAVRFNYQKPNELSSESRLVEPWALENIDGQWLLMAWDKSRKATRNFLLQRIIGSVKILPDVFQKPDAADLASMQRELQEFTENNIAEIRIQRDSQAWFHYEMDLPGVADGDKLTKQFMDLHLLADELREYALEIEVLRPVELQQVIRSGFEKVASDHHA